MAVSASIQPFARFDLAALVAAHGAPLLVLDTDVLRARYQQLAAALPGVRLFYAVKAFGADAVVSTLARCGASFDTASTAEGEQLRRLGIDARRVIHTHPIKKDADIRAALRLGCTTFVVDNLAELKKFVRYRHRVALLLRIAFPHPGARVDLSRKFGCRPAEVLELLQAARDAGIRIKGLSFHVGSQVPDASAHCDAVRQCAGFIGAAQARGLGHLRVLDIGGGFPANYDGDGPDIDRFCAPLRSTLAALPETVHVIAEPGRFLVAPAVTGVFSIVGKAWRGEGEQARLWYYLDDGVYGSFSGQMYDHTRYPLTVLRADGALQPSVIAGPTCDSIDVIDDAALLPEQEIGDLLVAPNMGAYCAASATDFNGIERARLVVPGEAELGARAG